MRITGLDFETANWCSGSICSIGVAETEDGILTEKREWLIRPHKSMDYMNSHFTAIHGIGYYDLRECPEFPEVWPVLRDLLLRSDCVAIHNASFDLRHLRAVLMLYQLPRITFQYLCTLELSRKKLPALPSHSLDAVAAEIQFSFQHHDALEDAAACVRIANALGMDQKLIHQFDFFESEE